MTDFVRLDNLYYAGSHGFDILGPHHTKLKEVAGDYTPALSSVYQVRDYTACLNCYWRANLVNAGCVAVVGSCRL